MEGLAGVGPVEGVGHRDVVIRDELPEFGLQFKHRGEVAPSQVLAVEDAEADFDLVEPRTVFRQVDEADAVSGSFFGTCLALR